MLIPGVRRPPQDVFRSEAGRLPREDREVQRGRRRLGLLLLLQRRHPVLLILGLSGHSLRRALGLNIGVVLGGAPPEVPPAPTR